MSSSHSAVGLHLSVRAAVQERRVVGSATAAGTLTVQGLEWKSLRVGSATLLLSAIALSTLLHWATGIVRWVKSVAVSVLVVVDSAASGKQERECVVGKLAFNHASVGSALVLVSLEARGSKVSTSTRSREVGNLPWGAIDAGIFGVDDSALVAFVQGLTESIDLVDWGSLTTSNVVVKVTPAAVFVQLTKRARCDSGGERPWQAGVLDQINNLALDSVKIGEDEAHETCFGQQFEHDCLEFGIF